MYPRTFASAWAIALVLTSVLPATMASHEPESIVILSPEEGATIAPDASVLVRFDMRHDSGPVLVEALLNGTVVGQVVTFARPMPPPFISNGTQVSVGINASSFQGGFYNLTVRASATNTTLVSLPVGVLLNHAPTITVHASYDIGNRTLRVAGNFSDEASGVTLLLNTPLGNASLTPDGTTFSHEQRGSLARGMYAVEAIARDVHGAEARTKANFTVADQPATFEILAISAHHGERFHVHGRVWDQDGPVKSVSVTTPFGGGSSMVYDGMFWIDFPIRGSVGVHHAMLRTADTHGGTTNVTVPFEIQGIARIFYEKEVDLDAGANVAVSAFRLPERSYGSVTLCSVVGNACIKPEAIRGDALVVEISDRAMDSDSHRCVLSGTARLTSCDFDARVDGTFGSLAWGMAGSGRLRVTVSGYEIT